MDRCTRKEGYERHWPWPSIRCNFESPQRAGCSKNSCHVAASESARIQHAFLDKAAGGMQPLAAWISDPESLIGTLRHNLFLVVL